MTERTMNRGVKKMIDEEEKKEVGGEEKICMAIQFIRRCCWVGRWVYHQFR